MLLVFYVRLLFVRLLHRSPRHHARGHLLHGLPLQKTRPGCSRAPASASGIDQSTGTRQPETEKRKKNIYMAVSILYVSITSPLDLAPVKVHGPRRAWPMRSQGTHKGQAHKGPGEPIRAWPIRAQGGNKGRPIRAQGTHEGPAHGGPGGP